MKLSVVKNAFIKTLPIMAGYLVLGIGFGILLQDAGYGLLWAFAMSLLIYAGSMQYIGVSLISGGASVIMTIITTIMVNARHLIYSISMISRYKDSGRYKPYLIFALTDETYSLLCEGSVPDEENVNLYRFLVSLFNHSYWVIFITSFVEQWLTADNHVPALTGLLSALFCLLVFGPEIFLIPAMLLITLVLTLLRRHLQGKKEVAE